MPATPLPQGSSLVRLSISTDGKALDDTVGVISVEIEKRVNRIPWARLVLLDGDMSDQTFPLSDGDTFRPGAKVRIAAGYGSGEDEEPIFEGVVVRHGVRVAPDGGARLVVECRHPIVAATVGRKNAHFTDKKDSDVVSEILSAYAGVSTSVDATAVVHPELVQYYCSDWDYVVARAEAAGLLVVADGGEVSVKEPDTSASPVLEVTWGDTLMEFDAETDARTQLASVSAVSWDPGTQQVVRKAAKPETLNRQGNLTSAKLADVVGLADFRLQTPAALDEATLEAWARARQIRAGLGRIRGRMRFQGSAAAVPGSLIRLTGVGDRFEGDVFVTGVEHRLEEGRWTTDAEFGLPDEWLTERPDVVAPPASGWTPGIEGLHVGVVEKLDEHPDGKPMIRVRLPILDTETGVWARLATLHATNEAGSFFVPDLGDEVVVGFFANDPGHPVVLGALHSTSRPAGYDLTAENRIRAFVTPEKLRILLDDETRAVTVETPGGNSVVLDDDAESITLKDQHGNSVVLGSEGITLDSPKDVTIKATGSVSLQATGNVEVASSGGDVKASGLDVSLEADVGFTAKGNASAELSASGQTTVKGAMVMIN
jgi:Rhs element Vgr protein